MRVAAPQRLAIQVLRSSNVGSFSQKWTVGCSVHTRALFKPSSSGGCSRPGETQPHPGHWSCILYIRYVVNLKFYA